MVNLREAWRIFSLTDWTEYIALTGQQTKEYNLIVSCGLVDLLEGGNAHTLLWAMFPEGTTTGDRFRDVTNGLVIPPPLEE